MAKGCNTSAVASGCVIWVALGERMVAGSVSPGFQARKVCCWSTAAALGLDQIKGMSASRMP